MILNHNRVFFRHVITYNDFDKYFRGHRGFKLASKYLKQWKHSKSFFSKNPYCIIHHVKIIIVSPKQPSVIFLGRNFGRKSAAFHCQFGWRIFSRDIPCFEIAGTFMAKKYQYVNTVTIKGKEFHLFFLCNRLYGSLLFGDRTWPIFTKINLNFGIGRQFSLAIILFCSCSNRVLERASSSRKQFKSM